ncbi:MAG: DUF1501 domain-containing protein [Phycisphaeraceae bacterium]
MASQETTRQGLDRRAFLYGAGSGFGALALTALTAREASADAFARPVPQPELNGGIHHRAKVKRVIQLFMNGGASPMDTFDPKPRLAELHGQAFDPGKGQLVESVTGSAGYKVLKSPFEFKQHGQSGRWVSSVFPLLASRVDDMAFLMSMASKSNVHGLASYMQNTGFTLGGFPCAGSWISYALGSIRDDLPAFVVMPDPRGLPYNNQGNFSSGFLPPQFTGTIIKATSATPINDLHPPKGAKYITDESETQGRALLKRLNEGHLALNPGDARLEARIKAYELAAKMQLSVPELFDLARESDATKKLYGVDEKPTDDFGRRCLLARRMIERGVRFVQVWSGAGGPTGNWDNHGNIATELPPRAAEVDKPIAGLLEDLKSRGLMEDTLVVWTTEFGRMPFSQGQAGRDHNAGTFVTWLAGAGIKSGAAVGESDEWGWKAIKPIWCYDLHATMLHLLGIDHLKLTVRHQGIERRLTDVHGHVIEQVLA